MPKRQPYRSPDGLDWRDPDMPLARAGREIDAAKLQKVCNYALSMSTEPDWRNDPTYNLQKTATKSEVKLGGFPWNCFNTCTTPGDCVLKGCPHVK